jgi:hypothetical protein
MFRRNYLLNEAAPAYEVLNQAWFPKWFPKFRE